MHAPSPRAHLRREFGGRKEGRLGAAASTTWVPLGPLGACVRALRAGCESVQRTSCPCARATVALDAGDHRPRALCAGASRGRGERRQPFAPPPAPRTHARTPVNRPTCPTFRPRRFRRSGPHSASSILRTRWASTVLASTSVAGSAFIPPPAPWALPSLRTRSTSPFHPDSEQVPTKRRESCAGAEPSRAFSSSRPSSSRIALSPSSTSPLARSKSGNRPTLRARLRAREPHTSGCPRHRERIIASPETVRLSTSFFSPARRAARCALPLVRPSVRRG